MVFRNNLVEQGSPQADDADGARCSARAKPAGVLIALRCVTSRSSRVVQLGATILPEIGVQPSDSILIKKRYSAFFGTNLDVILDGLGCKRIIVAGVNTHACGCSLAKGLNMVGPDNQGGISV
jgi:nicotinamidase-related amidase